MVNSRLELAIFSVMIGGASTRLGCARGARPRLASSNPPQRRMEEASMDRTRPDQGGALATTASSRLTRPGAFLHPVGRLGGVSARSREIPRPLGNESIRCTRGGILSPVHLGGERPSELRRQRIQGWGGCFFAGSARLRMEQKVVLARKNASK